MDAVLAELGQWLKEHRTEYARALQPGASDAMLDQCSAAIGKPLPDELRALYRWHDGQAEECFERLDRFGMFLSLERAEAIVREMDELAAAGDFPHPDWWSSGWFPFLWSGGGSYLCVDLVGCFGGHVGQIIELVGDELERVVWFPAVQTWATCLLGALRDGLLVVTDGDVEAREPERYEAFIANQHAGFPRTVPLAAED